MAACLSKQSNTTLSELTHLGRQLG